MRKIHGWILNLTDAEGPDPGTADVSALLNDSTDPSATTGRLDLEAHTLGYLDRTHQTGGAGSPDKADGNGHFGWDMEFSPGPITTRIVATDPQPTQHRARFPDESAQVGKAFHSDLERLGWAAGRDCLIWGAIEGAAPPGAEAWGAGNPTDTARLGDWGIADFGSGADAGRVLLNRGIGFLGGVLFSIETPNYPLLVPVLGEDAAEPNSGTTDRWDLLYAYMNIDPASATYGKQGIRIQRGGSTIEALSQVSGERRMVIHALKMPAGGGAYTGASDLRLWSNPIPGMGESDPVTRSWSDPAATGQVTPQTVGPGVTANSLLMTTMNAEKLTLSPTRRWMGQVSFRCQMDYGGPAAFFSFTCKTIAYDAAGVAIDGTDYVVKPRRGFERIVLPGSVPPYGAPYNYKWMPLAFTVPVRVIPSFAASSLATDSRSWTSLGFSLQFTNAGSQNAVVFDQHLNVHLWPVS